MLEIQTLGCKNCNVSFGSCPQLKHFLVELVSMLCRALGLHHVVIVFALKSHHHVFIVLALAIHHHVIIIVLAVALHHATIVLALPAAAGCFGWGPWGLAAEGWPLDLLVPILTSCRSTILPSSLLACWLWLPSMVVWALAACAFAHPCFGLVLLAALTNGAWQGWIPGYNVCVTCVCIM